MFCPPLEPLPVVLLAIAFGLSRSLLPFLYLRRIGTEQWHWFPLIFHLIHHGSSVVGAVLFPVSLRLKHSPAFLTSLAKTVCLLFLAIFHYVIDDDVLDGPMPFPLLFFVPPLFAVGVADGLQQRMLLTQLVVDAQRDATVAQQRHKLFTLLLFTSFGPFHSSLLIQMNATSSNPMASRCFGICPLDVHFGISVPTIFVMLALLQALPLPSLLLAKSADTTHDGDQYDEFGALHYLPTMAKCPPIWRLLLPLCALCAFSSALFDNFGTILFSVVPSNSDAFLLERRNFIVFSVSALFSRLALALSQCPSIIKFKLANLLHTNALFSVGLFGSGLAFCALNVASLHAVAVALFGASLALFWPIILAQWINFQDCLTVKNESVNKNCPSSTILGLLISVEFGSFLFPMLYTQLLAVYGTPRLFNTVALFLIIAMVVSFVCLLNVQAEYRTAKRGEFWGFWRGGRTRRSIRRLMRSVRTSLRRTSAGRRHRRPRMRPRMGTEMALLDEQQQHCGGAVSRISNYQSVQQGLSEHGGGQRRRKNTAHEIILISDDQQPMGDHKKRHISLPDIVLNVGTPKSSVCEKKHGQEEG